MFDNWAALKARFGSDALLVSVTPVVQSAVPAMCLDIEPGNAGPADAPAFQRLPAHGGAAKPVYYCSAGDLHLVVSALAAAGHSRDSYALWSAHWIGYHICGRATCGYPQADATQYASGTTVDYDVWDASVLALPAPPAVYPALSLGSRDPVDGANWTRLLQTRLDAWAKTVAPGAPELAVDGVLGPETALAVEAFQTMEKLKADGVAGSATWGRVLAPPVPPKPPAPPEPPPAPPPADWHYPAPARMTAAGGTTSFRLDWQPDLGGHPTPDHYALWVYKGGATAANLVAEYGPKTDIPGTAVTFEGGGLETGKLYTAHLSASGPGTEHLGRDVFASAGFTTG
jgi:peptidoglycan hydrolase-like protein with peptidoglycan-binding domain